MKRFFILFLVTTMTLAAHAAAGKTIRISTNATDLILQVGENGRLYQAYFGERLLNATEADAFSWEAGRGSDGGATKRGWDVMSGNGNEDYYEPAIAIMHNDGNPSTYLYYETHVQTAVEGGTETVVTLKDDKYPVTVKLHYVAYTQENVFKSWTEIVHHEKKPISMQQYASSMLYFSHLNYYLTQFACDWAKEVQMTTEQLSAGKKVLDTKLGVRSCMVMDPFFEVGFDQPAQEQQGKVLMGTLGWTGNFRFTFEVDNAGNLRVISGINPYASNYELAPGKVFTTPEAIFTLSYHGTSEGSRNFHDWARAYSLKDGQGDRMTLLNNWENTYFDFDQEKLSGLMKEAKTLGVDMFLLDDGWFGNGDNARNSDHAGLGDWDVNHAKLPGGLPALTKAAEDAGVKFGLWIEPEMVNPCSELYAQHKDWVIEYPNRESYYYRNQLVLDLANPKVQDYVYGVVENILKDNPEVAYFKWDCNSPIVNIYSPYLGSKGQNQLYIDHIRGLYNVLERVKKNYPDTPMMLCSGGGSRCDYEALKYFTEFWCSDDTEPVERCYIQWGFSQFFPIKSMCAHVTDWNRKASIKFRTDVASMCKLGFDLGLKGLSADELAYCQQAIKNWNRLKPAILDGDLYRLVSPYETNHMAVVEVTKDKNKAVLFSYDLHPRFSEKVVPVRLQGLDPQRTYRVEEINLMPGQQSWMRGNGQTFSGDYLMKVGLDTFSASDMTSRVVEITAE
ncbi:MAG: alpha-galactosidase [Bacteroidaceae bacterium]|nr:alpha-galactosidase [Bacteroidaceae bacterium]